MSSGLILSAFLLGVAGIPHCLTMCTAPCYGAAARCARGTEGVQRSLMALHIGRLLAYAAMGGILAASWGALSGWTAHVTGLRPLWVIMQVGLFVFGAWLLVVGRLPAAWAALASADVACSQAGSSRQIGRYRGWMGAFALGLGWSLLPCVQLYSGLLLAAMAASFAQGALAALAFALPGTLALLAGPSVLRAGGQVVSRLRRRLVGVRPVLVGHEQIVHVLKGPRRDGVRTPMPWSASADMLTVRLGGLTLMASVGWMLARNAEAGWRYLCGA